jgi:hypothetical protein
VLFPARDRDAPSARVAPVSHFASLLPYYPISPLHIISLHHKQLYDTPINPRHPQSLNKSSYPQPWASSASTPPTIRLSPSPASAPSQHQIPNRLCTSPRTMMEPCKWTRRHPRGRMAGTSRVQVESRAAIGDTGRVKGCATTGLMSGRYMVCQYPFFWKWIQIANAPQRTP